MAAERFEQELESEEPGAPSKRVVVEIDDRGLLIDEKIVCARDRFFAGGLEKHHTHATVLIMATSDDPKVDEGPPTFWFFRAPDRETAHALLRAAGLDAESHALQIRTSGGDWSIEGRSCRRSLRR